MLWLTACAAICVAGDAVPSPKLKTLLEQPGEHASADAAEPHAARWVAAPPSIAEFLSATCADCHGDGGSEGGFAIEELSWTPDQPAVFDRWVRLLDRVESGEMPPADYEQPSPEARTQFVASLKTPLIRADESRQLRLGRGRVRRLNRSEYETTLSDLLKTPLRVAEMLPEDARQHGFDTVGEALNLSSVQMESYLAALDVALDQATVRYPQPRVDSYRLRLTEAVTFMQTYRKGGPFRVEADGIALFGPELFSHYNGVIPQWTAPYNGRYRIAVSAYTVQSDEPVVLTLRAGGTGHSETAHVPSQVLRHFVVPLGDADHPTELVWEGRLQRGHFLHVEPSSLRKVRFGNNDRGIETKLQWDQPGVLVQHVDVDGPFYDQWPPASHRALWDGVELAAVEGAQKNGDPNSHLRKPPQRIAEPALKRIAKREGSNKRFVYDGPKTIDGRTFGGEPIHLNARIPDPPLKTLWLKTDQPHAEAERLLRAFLPRAFRRADDDVTDADVAPYLAIARRWMTEGATFEEAMRTAYKAILCSPEFLYRRDSLPSGPSTKLDSAAIAERLAYFLWNGPPDAELLAADLTDPDVRRSQAERLLGDARRDRFLTHLFDEWFDLRLIDFTAPDSALYPEHDPLLEWSMLEETRAFGAKLIDDDLPSAALVDADFAMLNWRLARHYGLDGAARPRELDDVDGMAVRAVPLPAESVRGGLLTQASVLKVTANGTTTSPVVRGVWVLDRILGTPPSPPPPGIPAIEPDIRGAVTIRDQLERHRADQACASCHAAIDPPGLALESFDVIGQQRSKYRVLHPKHGDDAAAFTPVERPKRWADGPKVDASGEVAADAGGNGKPRTFRGIRDYKRILLRDQRQLGRNVVEKLIVYATGAAPSLADRSAVESLLGANAEDGYRVRSILLDLVASDLFVTK